MTGQLTKPGRHRDRLVAVGRHMPRHIRIGASFELPLSEKSQWNTVGRTVSHSEYSG